ncbi:hypothetical protein Clacol_007529 [Clathrus columnatus]|uniref:Mitochondrial K+-H+ exchange-related-domain-containing protein n=1 Tax=Clathrus columnatus TaxID=1419009 RepID=A0AAV5AID7_9AGAM|nr:hypothetical protein Clacol_007529 [Clathrus columnatus]
MRILALPLTTRACRTSGKDILPLTYYHFHTPPPEGNPKVHLLTRLTNRASNLWANFGKADEKSWKVRRFLIQLLQAKLGWELSLKSLDPSLGPRIGQLRRDNKEKDTPSLKIPMFYPSSVYPKNETPLPHMQILLTKRKPHHRKGFYIWLIVTPLTAPFALVPIIPNLPFFYAAWRAWSHYKAWKSSEYMLDLIEEEAVVPHPNPTLDDIYATYPPILASHTDERADAAMPHGKDSGEKDSPDRPFTPPRLLLSSDGIPKIIETFKLSGSAKSDLHRAIQQAHVRIQEVINERRDNEV